MLLQDNRKRRKNAILLIWLVLILCIINTGFEILYVAHFDAIYEEEYGLLEAFFFLSYTFISLGYLIVIIISVVTFIQWFRRAYFNLHQKIGSLSYSEGWAAWAWFTPFINLYVPYRIMKEMYQYTLYLLNAEDSSRKYSLNSSNLSIWWALWIISGMVEGISFRLLRADDIEGSAIFSVLSCLLTIPLSVITVKLIKDYGVVEDELLRLENEGAPLNDIESLNQ